MASSQRNYIDLTGEDMLGVRTLTNKVVSHSGQPLLTMNRGVEKGLAGLPAARANVVIAQHSTWLPQAGFGACSSTLTPAPQYVPDGLSENGHRHPAGMMTVRQYGSERALVPTFEDILAARKVLAGHVLDTPCIHSPALSERTGAKVYLKLENLQRTASFKERGALNRMSALNESQRSKGVIAASAGNHAQGVAYHARRMGVEATIVMPANTPYVKVAKTQGHGAKVVLVGNNFDAAQNYAFQLCGQHGLTMIHPFDDPAVIAGQGTIALEMLAAQPQLDTLVIPIGGGGMISGMAIAAKAIKPDIKVWGVQTEHFPAMYAAYKNESRAATAGTIAEGIAVKSPGKITTEIVKRPGLIDDVMLVSESDIEYAIAVSAEHGKTVVEGAGAAALAALLRADADGDTRFVGRNVGLAVSGGNIDTQTLNNVIERGMVRDGKWVRIRVALGDQADDLPKAVSLIAGRDGNILAVHHLHDISSLSARSVAVDFVVKTRDHAHIDTLTKELTAAGYLAVRQGH